ncbi:glutathione S-transferase [Catenovulum sediminis]|uniref:glutathione S-transferase n=1 Tax=Catenovulum sediminis TaxID=1740262 RepID=UPI00117FC23D|nr:glutathione S-transferase [Catenovulum sediminis]
MSQLKLYGFELSGHSHRVSLFLSLLSLKFEFIQLDLANGEHKKPEFINKNIFGQVPVLEDQGRYVADSNAILVYLASTYDPAHKWLPQDPFLMAEIQRFLSVAAGPVAYGPARARIKNVFNAPVNITDAQNISQTVLTTLDKHLINKSWLVGDCPTIADIANYSYIAHAPEGGIDLALYPNVLRWLSQIEQLTGFVAMPTTPVGLNQPQTLV